MVRDNILHEHILISMIQSVGRNVSSLMPDSDWLVLAATFFVVVVLVAAAVVAAVFCCCFML